MATQSDVDPSGILDAQEPSKMSPDEKHPEPAQDAPLTKEEFAAQMHLLTERARAAGLNPIQTMARTYIKHGMAIIEGLLASLENASISKKKKE